MSGGLHNLSAVRFWINISIRAQMGFQSCSKTEDCQWIMTCISVGFSHKYCVFKCQINRMVFFSLKFILLCFKEKQTGLEQRSRKKINYGWTNHLMNLLDMQDQSQFNSWEVKMGTTTEMADKLISLLLFNELGEQMKSLEQQQENLLCEESHSFV